MGGVVGASAPGQLPRDEMQVTNVRRSMKGKKRGSGPNADADDLFVIMQQAHTEDPSEKFIRAIRSTPDPAIVIAAEYQVNDMVRFCTDSEFGIVTADPTFTLGDFDVTPITYRHLLLETKRSKKPPVFLGPVLIHYRKTFATYLFFASSLVGMSPQLEGVRAFGTDGEDALANALAHEFGFVQRLTCFIHVRRNVKDKLADCNIPSELAHKILDDIFGRKLGTVFVEGIVDASGVTDFQSKLEAVLQGWWVLSLPSTADLEKFIQYFSTRTAAVIRDTMLRPIREECGLGCPPDIFTTNASESINAILKRKVNYKRNELPDFIGEMKELIEEQQQEVERAIIGRGKYQFRKEYHFLEIQEGKWFIMNQVQRRKHIASVHSAVLSDASGSSVQLALPTCSPISPPALSQCEQATTDKSELSVDIDNALQLVNVPYKCLEGIWGKAKDLINTENAIVPAPGQDPTARMVLSYSGQMPHLVTPKKGGDFACDSNCANWKAMGICSHSVAVADINDKLMEFLAKKTKKRANMTKLLTTNMPKGRGRKGGVAPRSRKPSEPVAARVAMNVPHTNPASTTTSMPTPQPGMMPPTPSFSPPHMLQPPVYGETMVPYPTFYPDALLGVEYPASPNPYWPNQSQPLSPFTLCYITGNISTCIGCKNKYLKTRVAQDDLCIKHEEWRQFTSPSSGTPQSKFGSAYYHCKVECVWLRHPHFQPQKLQVPQEVAETLSLQQKEYVRTTFNLLI